MRSLSRYRIGVFVLVSLVIHLGLCAVLPGTFSPVAAPSGGSLPALNGRLTADRPAEFQGAVETTAELSPLPVDESSEVRAKMALSPAVAVAPGHDPAASVSQNGVYYWPVAQVERVALPVSAPDLNRLAASRVPSGTVRLRLFIGAHGQVDAVQVLGSEDDGIWTPLRDMFLATGFLPAKRGGRDVASVQDLEIDVSDLMRTL